VRGRPDKASVADSGISLGIVSGTATNKAVTLTAGAKDIYVVVENAEGIVSDPLRIDAAAYVAPTYTISVDPTAITFTGASVGYDNTTMAQTVTNTAQVPQLSRYANLPCRSDFEICETLPSSNLSRETALAACARSQGCRRNACGYPDHHGQ
jgi:hypothetical protein